jgi:hypothetical protein
MSLTLWWKIEFVLNMAHECGKHAKRVKAEEECNRNTAGIHREAFFLVREFHRLDRTDMIPACTEKVIGNSRAWKTEMGSSARTFERYISRLARKWPCSSGGVPLHSKRIRGRMATALAGIANVMQSMHGRCTETVTE